MVKNKEKKLLKERYKQEMTRIKESYKKMIQEEEKRHKEKIEPPSNAFISLRGVNKVYDNYVYAVHDFSLDIEKDELVVFVGPSGCGKSTTLRMIAGLEEITTGDLFIDGKLANELSAKERDVSMVFQNYALYPHMSIFDNIAFSLQVRHYPKEEIEKRVKETAKTLQIEDYLYRFPKELSGGQRQRVALGRAIARQAKVFLMDEPLSNLDAKLRVSMRSEIIRLHNEFKTTTIYVTHDQAEAMTMADKIVIMKDGIIQQVGAPEIIYNHPKNTFVANFIGSPAMNLVNASYSHKGEIVFLNGTSIPLSSSEIKAHNDFYLSEIARVEKLIADKAYEEPDRNIVLTYHKEPLSWKTIFKKKEYPHIKSSEEKLAELNDERKYYQDCLEKDHDIIFGIRPEDIHLKDEISKKMRLTSPIETKVDLFELLGSEYHLHLIFNEESLIAKCENDKEIKGKKTLEVYFDLRKMHIFDKKNERAIF